MSSPAPAAPPDPLAAGPAPKVSVVIPAYNAAATIERAVRSAQAQTLRDIEIIVVDDVSTDDTVARIEALQRSDPRIVLLRHPSNRGAGAARNTAIAAARGEWIAPLDSDDAFHPERLERLSRLGGQQQADLVADNLCFGDTLEGAGPAELAYTAQFIEAASPLTAAALLDSDMPRNGVCSFGYLKPLKRRAFLVEHGLRYDETLRVTEDFQFHMAAVLAGARFVCTGWPGYYYYRTPGSLTRSPAQYVKNLEIGIEGNRRLTERARRTGNRDALRWLGRHRRRLRAVLWLDRLRLAVKDRSLRQAGHLLATEELHPLVVGGLVLERLVLGRRLNPPSLAGVASAAPASAAGLSVRLLREPAQLEALLPEWRALYERAGMRLPFQHPTWVVQWWRHFGRSHALAEHELCVVTVREGAALAGVLPLYRTSYGLRGLPRFRFLRPLGSDPNVTELQAPLIAPGLEPRVLAALARLLGRAQRAWDLLNWGDWPEALAPPADFPGHKLERFSAELEDFVVPLPPGWEAFTARLKRNVKESIRKSHNALERDGLAARFDVLADPAEIAGHLPRFFELHRQRAAQAGSVAHGDMFAAPRHRDFLATLVQALGAQGAVRLFRLEVAGKVVALRLGFVIDDTLYLYFSGYETAFARYSVMTRLVVEVLKWAIAQQLATVNLSFGRDQSKLRWSPIAVRYRAHRYLSTRRSARLAYALLSQLSSLKPA